MSEVIDFGHQVEELLALPEPPEGAGSARAVATAVVHMCWEFAQCWSRESPVTSGLLTAFARQIDVIEFALDAIADRSVTESQTGADRG